MSALTPQLPSIFQFSPPPFLLTPVMSASPVCRSPPPPYSAEAHHYDSSDSSTSGPGRPMDTDSPSLSAIQADVDATQRAIKVPTPPHPPLLPPPPPPRSISFPHIPSPRSLLPCVLPQQLQADLQRSFDTGDAPLSASLAQSLTHYTQQLKAQQSLVDQSHAIASAEKVWLSDQLNKVNAIKAVVETKRREVELIQHTLRDFLIHHHSPSPPSQSSSSSSLFSSVFHSSSSQSPPPVTCAALLARARKSIKECQVILEQQNLIVDSIDMNEHPSTLLSASSNPSDSLSSIKAVRKDTVTYIQGQLQHVDAFEQHVVAFEAFIAFLDKTPRPSYRGEDEKGQGGGGGGTGGSPGLGGKKKSGRR